MPSSITNKGVNDLATLHPEIAAEADGWDPKTITPGSNKKMPWKCKEGHTSITTPDERTGRDKTSCPVCADHGFNPGEPSWLYLLESPGEQQLGITNNFDQRMRANPSSGWIEIEKTGPHPGEKVLETENAFKKWLRKKVGLVPDKQENWYTSKMEVHSLAELKEKSGIATSIF